MTYSSELSELIEEFKEIEDKMERLETVSYTHLTLPTKA